MSPWRGMPPVLSVVVRQSWRQCVVEVGWPPERAGLGAVPLKSRATIRRERAATVSTYRRRDGRAP